MLTPICYFCGRGPRSENEVWHKSVQMRVTCCDECWRQWLPLEVEATRPIPSYTVTAQEAQKIVDWPDLDRMASLPAGVVRNATNTAWIPGP